MALGKPGRLRVDQPTITGELGLATDAYTPSFARDDCSFVERLQAGALLMKVGLSLRGWMLQQRGAVVLQIQRQLHVKVVPKSVGHDQPEDHSALGKPPAISASSRAMASIESPY